MSGETRLETVRRRTQVAGLLCANPGIKAVEIADMLGYHPSTIRSDIKAIRREWAERRLLLYESRVAEDIIRTDEAIKAIWPHVTAGKGWAIDRLMALLNYRLKALGLDVQRYELDIGSVLANYLARASREVQAASGLDSGAALDDEPDLDSLPTPDTIDGEYKIEEPVAEGSIYKEEE